MKKKRTIKRLNDRHRKFCKEYLKDFNATRSYKAVYPSVTQKTAASNGSQLLGNAKVQEYLAELLHQSNLKDIADVDEVLTTITAIALGKPRRKILKRIDNNTKDGKPKVEYDSVTITQPTDKDQLKALELLSRYYKIFMDVSNPELDDAKLRKLNAETRVIEVKANVAERLNSESNEQLDELLDRLVGKVDSDGAKSTSDG